MHPELMVIGDSLSQGCRSLSVSQPFCQQSWPAQIARSQGWQFIVPDFPRPILFDLEFEIRQLGDLIQISPKDIRFQGLLGRFFTNLRAWLANKIESKQTGFDNLGLAGCQPYDLYARTAVSSNAEIQALCPQGSLTQALDLSNVGKLHLAINGRFVLNPSQDPQLSGMTPLDWVEARVPKRVLFQCGHNNGLYAIGADADPANVNFTQPNDNGDDFYASFNKIAVRLAMLPDAVQQIAVLLLPKVGAVANLAPSDNSREDGYAPYYSAAFSTSKTMLSGKALSGVDLNIAAANAKLRQIFSDAATASQRPNRFVFVDTFELFNTIDYKNSLTSSDRIVVDASETIDNYYLHADLVLQPPFPPGTPPWKKILHQGGFQSIDGMHPTGCGYAYIAFKVIESMQLPNADLAKMLEQAYLDDTLLHDFPLKLDLLISVLAELRRLSLTGLSPVQPQSTLVEGGTEPHLVDVVAMSQKIFKR
jgi:GDSL-like Lipase/Acylhydrolase